MKIKKVLIVYKRSAFESYFSKYRHPAFQKLAKIGDKVLKHIHRSHHVHYSSLRYVESILSQNHILFDKCARGREFNPSRYDLILAVGGDGTFLDAARYAGNKLILGINSDSSHSVGKFCRANRKNFERIFKKILKGRFKVIQAQRLEFYLNGKRFKWPVLNEILAAHKSPAAMSHYILKIGPKNESQRSSGLWISTPAGSTGAIQSAGGKKMKINAKHFEYLPRELYSAHGCRYKLKGALLSKDSKLEIISQMQEGMIYVDGAHTKMPFHYGDRLKVTLSGGPLRMIEGGN